MRPETVRVGLRVHHNGRPGQIVSVDGDIVYLLFDDGSNARASLSGRPLPSLAREPKPLPRPDPLQVLLGKAMEPPPGIWINPPRPDKDDCQLAVLWDDKRGNVHRMLSARLAERAVALYYRGWGAEVIDIAATQLADNPGQDDWRDFDLLVDALPIDVKNATRSEANPRRYVSHCVAKFKQSRHLDDVAIAGVVSEWSPEDRLHDDPPPVLFLGTTTAKRIEQLRHMLADSPLQLSLRRGLNGPKFLPPWLFAYDIAQYTRNQEALAELVRAPAARLHAIRSQGQSELPVFLATGKELPAPTEQDLGAAPAALCKALQSRVRRHGVALDVVFLTILEHFLIGIQAKRPVQMADVRPILFAGARDFPLFVHDPLQVIDGLLFTLDQAATAEDELSTFNQFELADLNILRARKSSHEPWQTVLAYCGGWLEDRACGNTPLVIGVHLACRCSRLVCDRCGYCSAGCPGPDGD